MIKNQDILQTFEKNLRRNKKTDLQKNLKIISELHQYARKLGIFGKNIMDGIEVDLRVARIINHVRETT
jgi:hypothetical protein